MQLPAHLRQAIEDQTAQCNPQALSQAAGELSENYRARRSPKGRYISSDAHRLAYVVTRLPATFAATHAVFAEIHRLLPTQTITTLLDLGAGPGTASWSATTVFRQLQDLTLIEQDEGLIATGKSLAQSGNNDRLINANWTRADLRSTASFSPHDLVVSSYALGELDPKSAKEVILKAWSATQAAIAIIEPGTKIGFEYIRELRTELIAQGGHILAPCPHQNTCPIANDDWCHFAQRVDRSSQHRRIKSGTLGHEDEKFAYVVATKQPATPAQARILRHPTRRSGHTHLSLCTSQGIEETTVTRSDKKKWKRVRKINWGDAWI